MDEVELPAVSLPRVGVAACLAALAVVGILVPYGHDRVGSWRGPGDAHSLWSQCAAGDPLALLGVALLFVPAITALARSRVRAPTTRRRVALGLAGLLCQLGAAVLLAAMTLDGYSFSFVGMQGGVDDVANNVVTLAVPAALAWTGLGMLVSTALGAPPQGSDSPGQW